MSAKTDTPGQHNMLHQYWPPPHCCLCNAETRIMELEWVDKDGKMLTRKELRHIRDTAIEESCDPELNDTWRLALLRLSDAADHLDAMLARSEEKIHSPVS